MFHSGFADGLLFRRKNDLHEITPADFDAVLAIFQEREMPYRFVSGCGNGSGRRSAAS
jgi:hypothetical protein